jgi:hypothetical protein
MGRMRQSFCGLVRRWSRWVISSAINSSARANARLLFRWQTAENLF